MDRRSIFGVVGLLIGSLILITTFLFMESGKDSSAVDLDAGVESIQNINSKIQTTIFVRNKLDREVANVSVIMTPPSGFEMLGSSEYRENLGPKETQKFIFEMEANVSSGYYSANVLIEAKSYSEKLPVSINIQKHYE